MDEGGTKMSKSVWNNFDPLSIFVIVLTLVLFVLALFANGFTHDLLQECGVFLVSVKLIMMSHKNGVSARLAEERLEKIQNLLQTTREQSA
jgi:Na+-translocating ferredoxin:NAD+ oxidoreductase RnfE subunit